MGHPDGKRDTRLENRLRRLYDSYGIVLIAKFEFVNDRSTFSGRDSEKGVAWSRRSRFGNKLRQNCHPTTASKPQLTRRAFSLAVVCGQRFYTRSSE